MKGSMIRFDRIVGSVCVLALALLVTSLGIGTAHAAKVKQIQTEAKFLSFDATANTITVKVLKTGKKPKQRALKLLRGKKAEFRVKPEGSVMTRTIVKSEGRPIKMTEIPEDKTITIFWVPDEKVEKARFAKSISLTLTDEEAEARDKLRLEEAKASGKLEE